MSREELELWRASLDELARAGEEDLDPEAATAKMAEIWDPEVDRVVALIDLRMRGRSTGIEMPLDKHAFVATFRTGWWSTQSST